MDERKVYKDALSKFAPEMTEEQQDKYIDFTEQKKSTVLRGDDVIHLNYFHGLIDELDIKYITAEFRDINLRLSRYDKNGIIFGSLKDYSLQISFALSNPIVQGIIAGLTVNAVWAGVKKAVWFIWKKIMLEQMSLPEKSKMNFGLRVETTNGAWVDFKLDGNFSEQTVLTALDKILPIIQQKRQFERDKLNFLIFDPENNEWNLVDTMAEFRRIANEQQLKRNSANI